MYVFVAALIAAVLVAALICFNTPKGKGKLGEALVRLVIGRNKKNKRYVINDFIFRIGEKTVQIDHVVIKENGVFVIETKNYFGKIYGNDRKKNWLLVQGKGKKQSIYSPVKQNQAHIAALSSALPLNVYLKSLVVFVQNNTENIDSSSVIPIKVLKKQLALPSKTKPYTVPEMKSIYESMLALQNSEITEKTHLQRLKEVRENIEHNICPYCKRPLVTRNGEWGEFLSCSGYPECTFKKAK
jgi:hypothetical protein